MKPDYFKSIMILVGIAILSQFVCLGVFGDSISDYWWVVLVLALPVVYQIWREYMAHRRL